MRLLSCCPCGRPPGPPAGSPRKAGRIPGALAVLALLYGCGSELQPFETGPRILPGQGAKTSDLVGICYNAVLTTPDKVKASAAEACGPGTVAVLEKQDLRLACPLLLPIRATFLCREED